MQAQELQTDGKVTTVPGRTARELVLDLLGRMSVDDRLKPVAEELHWVMGGRKNPTEHKQILPDYCYEIFDVWRRTLFKNLPGIEDTICLTGGTDTVKAKPGKTGKQNIRIDWRCLGRVIGIGERGVQFFEFEAIALLKAEGLLDLKPEEEEMVLRMTFGNRWLKQKLAKLIIRPHRCVKRFVEKCRSLYFRLKILGFSRAGRLAYQAGPKAYAEFKAGVAEGQVGFLDHDGNLVGESNRSSNYQFLLLVWPEIKEMLERKPLPTRTDVFDWTKPYTKAGVCSFIDIDQFRDVCEDIKLKFAGRCPKKAPHAVRLKF